MRRASLALLLPLLLYVGCVDLKEPWSHVSRDDAASARNEVGLSSEPGGGFGGAGGGASGGSDLDGGFDTGKMGSGGVSGAGTGGGASALDANGGSGAGRSGSPDGRDCCDQDVVDASQPDRPDAADKFDQRDGAEAGAARDLGRDSDKADGGVGGVSGSGGSRSGSGGITSTGGRSGSGGSTSTGGSVGTGGSSTSTGGSSGAGGNTGGPNLALDATWWGDGVSLNKTGNYPRIFVSSVQSTSANTAAGLCDGSTRTFWVSTGDASTPTTFPQWVGVEFTSAVTITAVVLNGRMNDNRAYNPSHYVIQTSDDGSTWTDQVTVEPPTSYPLTQNPATSPIKTVLPNPTRAKWVRVFISAAFYVIAGQQQPTVPNVQIAELEIH